LNHRIEPSPSVLYIVGTPIGNLGDLSKRAGMLIKEVSVIACEDTRHSGPFIRRLGSKANLLSFHRHNTQTRIPTLLALLGEGKSLALISDAGLPGICDPGEALICAAKEAGHEVICIPGPCAATTALVTSGLPTNRFCFEGFLPIKGKERKQRLMELQTEQRTSIIYEAPHRLLKLLKELLAICGEQRALHVCRELTKIHEEHIGPTIGAAIEHFKENKPLGEFTIVLGGAVKQKISLSNPDQLINKMQSFIKEGASSNEAARKIAQETGHSKRFLYELLHKNKAKEKK